MLHRGAASKDRVVRWVAACDCNPDVKISAKASELTDKASCGCLDSHAQMNLDHNHTRQSAGRMRVLWPASDAVPLRPGNLPRLTPITPPAFSSSELPLAA